MCIQLHRSNMAEVLLQISLALSILHSTRHGNGAHAMPIPHPQYFVDVDNNREPSSMLEIMTTLQLGTRSTEDLMRLSDSFDFWTNQIDDSIDDTHHQQWMNSGKFQGDIIGVDLEMKLLQNEAADPAAGLFYNAIKSRHMLWPNSVIPYALDRRYTQHERHMLQGAFDEYAQRTCVRFVPRTNENDFLNIVKGYGCYSHVGRTRGRQELSLGFGCTHHEIAVHELMHAVGFWHEHSRADRDTSINIQWHNIAPGMSNQFDMIRPDIQDLLGEPYDYLSVMHYDRRAYSRNGRSTIETVDPAYGDKIGRAKRLSKIDVNKINKLYNCPQQNGPGTTPITTRRPTAITVAPPTPRPIVPPRPNVIITHCRDKFADCSAFGMYCFRADFVMVMRTFCPNTCGAC